MAGEFKVGDAQNFFELLGMENVKRRRLWPFAGVVGALENQPSTTCAARESQKQKDKETDNMREEKKKASGNTDEDELTKVQEVSEEVEVNEFVDGIRDIKNAIDYLMDALESKGRRLEVVLDDDDFALSEGRIASALLALLAEQGEKLKDEATDYKKNVDKFVNP